MRFSVTKLQKVANSVIRSDQYVAIFETKTEEVANFGN